MASRKQFARAAVLLLMLVDRSFTGVAKGGKKGPTSNVFLTLPASVSGTTSLQVAGSDISGSVGVNLYHDGGLIDSCSISPTRAVSLSYPWESTLAADGTHSLQAKAAGSSGVVVSSAPKNVVVSYTTPMAPPPALGGKVTTVKLGVGWATFGQVVPQGAAPLGLQIGTLPTQLDVKTRWPDGSIKFAVVSTFIPAAGPYDVTASSARLGGFKPAVPAVSATFTIGTQLYVATLPSAPSADTWLAGPVVQEWRSVVTPIASGAPHPFLRVIFDVRSYSDGSSRLDVTVENVLNMTGATAVTYDVAITVSGRQILQARALTHYWMTRWRKTFSTGTLADVTPDFEPVFQGKALPRYLSIVTENKYSTSGPKFGLLGGGDFHNPMNDHGGRPEIAPYPDWVARYLVRGAHASGRATKEYLLAMDEQAGAWPMHIRETDGTLVSIDAKPYFWLDKRCDIYLDSAPHLATCPQGDMTARGPLQPEPNNHQPSIGYQSYLLTGDRFFLDEMRFWANYSLIGTFEDNYSNWRGSGKDSNGKPIHPGSWGSLYINEIRGIAWGLRTLTDAAAWLPDTDPMKGYLANKVQNNLADLDAMASSTTLPMSLTFLDLPGYHIGQGSPVSMPPWQRNYVAWAIDHAQQQGFSGGGLMRDRIVRFTLSLFTSDPDYPRAQAGAYQLVVATLDDSGSIIPYTNLRQMYAATLPFAGADFVPFRGYYGLDVRLALMIGLAQGWPGAQSAYDYLYPIIGVQVYVNGVSDLANRAGWALR